MDPLVKLATLESQTSLQSTCATLCVYANKDTEQVRKLKSDCLPCSVLVGPEYPKNECTAMSKDLVSGLQQ